MRSEPTRRYRTLGRSVRLFRSFLVEQTDPERFYTDLAEDTVALVGRHEPLHGAHGRRRGRRAAGLPAGLRGGGGALHRGRRRPRGDPPSARAACGIQARGELLPFADGIGRRRHLQQRHGARRAPRRPRGGDAPRGSPRRARRHLATRRGPRPGAGTRPRRGTGWGATTRRAATPAGTATRRRTATARPCTRPACPTGCAGPARARTPGWSRPCPGTTPTGPVSSSTCPGCGRSPPGTSCSCSGADDRSRPRAPASARGGAPPRLGGGMVGARRPHLRGHQERPVRRPVGLPRAGRSPVGPPGDLGRAPEPGLRLPLPDGPVLRCRRRGRAGLGGAAAVVGRDPHRRPAHRARPPRCARGGAARRPAHSAPSPTP